MTAVRRTGLVQRAPLRKPTITALSSAFVAFLLWSSPCLSEPASGREANSPRLEQDPAPPGRVGLVIASADDGRIVVSSVASNSPAERAGILAEDVIMEVDGAVAQGRAPAEVSKMIGGPAGTDVTLLVWRPSRRTSEKLVLRRVASIDPTPTPKPSPTPAAGAASGDSAHPRVAAVRFQRFSIVDEQGTHSEAYHMLIPSGWKGEGKILWDLERRASPAALSVRVRNPDASEEFDSFPALAFTWSPLLQQMGATGRYLGCEIARPVDGPLAALRQVVLPRFRPELREYQLVSAEELPKLAQAAAPLYQQPGMSGVVRAGRMRIQYPEGSAVMQEELSCIFAAWEGPSGALWALDSITSFRAPKEKLEALLPGFRIMLFSLQPDLQWYAELQSATRILVEGFYQEQAQIMKRVQIEREKNDAIRGIIRQEFESRQAAMSRIHENYDTKAVRGVQRHVNPFDGGTEDVPNEYKHAWVNPLGEHIFTNDPSFDPNIGSNHDWREMPEKN